MRARTTDAHPVPLAAGAEVDQAAPCCPYHDTSVHDTSHDTSVHDTNVTEGTTVRTGPVMRRTSLAVCVAVVLTACASGQSYAYPMSWRRRNSFLLEFSVTRLDIWGKHAVVCTARLIIWARRWCASFDSRDRRMSVSGR